MTKLIVILSVVAGATLLGARPVAANCGTNYVKCLNDTYYLEGVYQTLADISCGAEYLGCLRRVAMEG